MTEFLFWGIFLKGVLKLMLLIVKPTQHIEKFPENHFYMYLQIKRQKAGNLTFRTADITLLWLPSRPYIFRFHAYLRTITSR
ncbi:hypothetical protein DC20_04650 [Rufibacter tibetensis]|uniref:Uncharacterized protein n=1 Tax=Rufibacter tibetensis TaxID=512763 RepID=A0A0P0CPY5_9BACT|nr:hypothetical protein DC20_04650 [Rufibacter tibetensis]